MNYKSARKIFAEGRCPSCGDTPPCFRFDTKFGLWICSGCSNEWRGTDAWFWTIAERYGWIIGEEHGRACYESMRTGDVIVLDTYRGVQNPDPHEKNSLGPHSERWYAPIGPFYKTAYDTESDLLAAYRCGILVRHTEAEWAAIQDQEDAQFARANPALRAAVDHVCTEIFPKVHEALRGVAP